jgi:hypothetical protein
MLNPYSSKSTDYAVVGVDIGQSHDYTAVCVLKKAASDPLIMHVVHLARYPLGTLYPAVVSNVTELMHTPQLRGAQLVVDATGVGRAVFDMFGAASLKPVGVLVTGGDVVNHEGGYWRVPKRDLVAAVQVPLQDGRLKFAAGMPLVSTLVQEMLNFKIKITAAAHDTYGAWREGENDDLIFATMLACWWARRVKLRAIRQYDGLTGKPVRGGW